MNLSLAIRSLLHSKDKFLAWFGMKCSSWSKMNTGTSQRGACCSVGNLDRQSVKYANALGERRQLFWVAAPHKQRYRKHNIKTYIYIYIYDHINSARPWFARTCLLCLLVAALGGTWALEQPSGSWFEFFPPWQFVLLQHLKIAGHAVAKAAEQFCLSFLNMPGHDLQ